MQDLAHVIVNGETVLVLRRSSKYGCDLKMRNSGKIGKFLDEESFYLDKWPHLFSDLKRGKVLKL